METISGGGADGEADRVPTPVPRRFGQLPSLIVPDDFDDALREFELAGWTDAGA